MAQNPLRRIALAYIFLQLIIWVKSAYFFSMFGHGKVLLFSVSSFPRDALFFDFYFHALMHGLIAILAVLFGKNLPQFKLGYVLPVVFAAVALHNFAYWLTYSHPSLLYTLLDFGSDSAILLSAVFAGFILSKNVAVKKLKIPILGA